MKLPSCLVGEGGQPALHGRPSSADAARLRRYSTTKHNKNATKATANWVGLALLLTTGLFSDPNNINMHQRGVSTSISTFSSPSALYELASFIALEENAEEEGLAMFYDAHTGVRKNRDRATAASSWRSSSSISNVRVSHSTGATMMKATSAVLTGAATPQRILRSQVTVRDTLAAQGGSLARPVFRTNQRPATQEAAAVQCASSSAALPSSAESSPSFSFSDHHQDISSSDGEHGEGASSQGVHLWSSTGGSPWQQLHVLDLAQEIHHDGFLASTRALTKRGLFPTVYRCFVDDIALPEDALFSSNTTPSFYNIMRDASSSTANSRQTISSSCWCCTQCSRAHHSVRESCLRCHAPCPNVSKVFLGQLRKELPCDDLLKKIIWATTFADGGIVPLRVEGHTLSDVGLNQCLDGCHSPHPVRRGKGCGSVYVSPHEANRLVALLHKNVFLDHDWVSGKEVVYFVYAEQRIWFDEFVAARVMVGGSARAASLPHKALVCEMSGAAGGVVVSERPFYGASTDPDRQQTINAAIRRLW